METYEDSLENLKNAWGIGFMKTFPGIAMERNDIPEEIDVEKARYLLSVDDLLEEMLS